MIPKLLIGAVAAATMSVPFAGVAWADVSVSVGGFTVADDGGPSTATTLGLSLAYASNNSQAGAFGLGSVAIATNGSFAGTLGVLDTAIADNNSDAGTGPFGGGNTAIARDGSTAATIGFFNRVTATNNSSAVARGAFNNVTADGNSGADISGIANSITLRCGGSLIDPSDSSPETVLSAQSYRIVTKAPCETG